MCTASARVFSDRRASNQHWRREFAKIDKTSKSYFPSLSLKLATKLLSGLKVSGRSQRGSAEAVVFGSSRRGLMPMNNLGAEFNFLRTRNISATLVVSPDDGRSRFKPKLKKYIIEKNNVLMWTTKCCCFVGCRRFRRRKCSSGAGGTIPGQSEAAETEWAGPTVEGRRHTWRLISSSAEPQAG